jgi:hypothetical protein
MYTVTVSKYFSFTSLGLLAVIPDGQILNSSSLSLTYNAAPVTLEASDYLVTSIAENASTVIQFDLSSALKASTSFVTHGSTVVVSFNTQVATQLSKTTNFGQNAQLQVTLSTYVISNNA